MFLLYLFGLVLALCNASLLQDIGALESYKYDFVIVGGGTAGLVLANRLSENPKTTVLVIEAGVSNEGAVDTIVPFYLTRIMPGSPYDWNYTTTSQASLNNRSIPYRRGHILGGSSSVNFLVYTRGPAEDYDRMARFTNDPGWSWDNLLPYIFRNERFSPPADHHNITGEFNASVHGYSGLLGDSLPGFPTPLDERVLETTSELADEFPFNLDMNSGYHLGIAWQVSTVRNGTRSSSAVAYYNHATQQRHNLDVVLNTRVTRLIADSSLKFHRVEAAASYQGPYIQIEATKEIILSAGSIGSAQILMASGIGDAQMLGKLGIKSILNNPSVGQNLTDHPIVGQSFFVNSTDTWETALRNATLAEEELALWNETRTGPLTDSTSNYQGWLRIPSNSTIFSEFDDPSAGPNSAHYELLFQNGVVPVKPTAPPAEGNFMTVSSVVVSPLSRGAITLNSSNVFDPPIINPNLLDSDFDMFVMRDAILSVRRFLSSSAWSSYILAPVANVTTDAELDFFIRNNSRTVFHPAGTAAMTARNATYGVVDPDCRVKGTKGLRIVDASIFPFIPTAHLQVPVYILAERAADLIKESWDL